MRKILSRIRPFFKRFLNRILERYCYDTKAQKIEASVENSCTFCGAFTSGLTILAHASQLEAQFQNLLNSPCCPYMDVCTYVLSQEGLSFCPQHDVCAISHGCVDSEP